MGNRFSCVCLSNSPVVKVADLDGNVHEFGSGRTVGELMIEFPGCVVALAEEFRRCRRVRSMRADEETKLGKLYVLFPMERMNTRVSDEEMAAVTAAVSRRLRSISSEAKVFPSGEDENGTEAKVNMGETETPETGFAHLRLPTHRRWRPELESINELKCIR